MYFREGDYMIIKVFSDKSKLEYDKGSFDDWCVYYTNAAGIRKPPKDTLRDSDRNLLSAKRE